MQMDRHFRHVAQPRVERENIASLARNGVADAFLGAASSDLGRVWVAEHDSNLRAAGRLLDKHVHELRVLLGQEKSDIDKDLDAFGCMFD